jgi:hypothetical protein
MGTRKKRNFDINEVIESFNQLLSDKPLLPLAIPLILAFWAIERWIFSFSNWVPLAVAVWATIQYGSYQRRILVEDLNKQWKQVILQSSPMTPLEHCEWLNKLLIEIWPKFMSPKLSTRFSTMIEKRLKHRKSRLIERIELQMFSLGSTPPILGIHGNQWTTTGDQRVMRMGFDWDTSEISIMLLAKLAKPLLGTARIIVNSIHIKGDILLMPALEGKALLYSFVSTPEVRIGVAFGSGGSDSLPATELPGVSSWLVKLITELLVKTMVEPRRRCYSLPPLDLNKKAVGGVLYVTVLSASKLSGNRRQMSCGSEASADDHQLDSKDLQTFVEIELEDLSRRTDVKPGCSPRWNSTFNMAVHDDNGIIRFHLYQCTPGSVKYDYLSSCEVKMKYVLDDSTMFWAIGSESSIIARQEFCGKEIEMVVPFEGGYSGELTVRLVLKEWHFADGSNSFHLSSHGISHAASSFPTRTGRKIYLTVVEGKDLFVKEKGGKSYVKLQYGKTQNKTKSAPNASNPTWNQKFEYDEIMGDEYLMLRCFSEETFSDDNIGGARVNLEGLVEGSVRDVWVPLEKVSSGELRLKIEVARVDDFDGSRGSNGGAGNGWIELVLIEARELIAADLRGTSDPYVRVQYGNLKKRTKVMYKTLSPKWNQTLEFPDNGSPLMLHVKDHNALLPTSNIGDCEVEYQRLPPNEKSDKWIPLQGVKKGEIHVQVTRKIPELRPRSSLDSESSSTKVRLVNTQMKQMMIKFHTMIEDGNLEGLSSSLIELESLHDMQEECTNQLETEQMLLLNKIKELGDEIFHPASSLARRSSNA